MEKPGSEVRCPPGERAHQWAFALRAEFTDPKASLLDSHLERDEGWMSYGLPCEFGDDGEELDRDWQDPWPVSDDVRAEWGRRNTELYAGYCAMDTENDVRSPWKLVGECFPSPSRS